MAQHVLIGDLGPALMITAVRGPLLVFFLPAPILGAARAQPPRPRRPRHPPPAARRVHALGGEPRDLAHPIRLRPRARAPEPPQLRAPLLDGLRDPRLDAPRRPGLAPPADGRRPGRARGVDVRGRNDPLRRPHLRLHAALSVLPRCVRDLGAARPAARRDRDDGRAARHARDLRRAAAAPALEPRPPGSPRPAGRQRRPATSAGDAATPPSLPADGRRERNVVQLRAALPRPRDRRRRALLARGPHRPSRDVARRRLRVGSLPHRGLAQLAARDDRRALPPAHPPAPERADRGRRAAARLARPDAGDAGRARPPRR